MNKRKTIKILAIGNSFSMDAMTFLWDIFKSANYEEVILGNLYIAGCSLETHSNHILNNNKAYDYYYNDNGKWVINNNKSVLEVLNSKEWDVVTTQQSSNFSGLKESYQPFLNNIVDFIRRNVDINKTKIAWHMTWAYQSTHTHSAFKLYDYNQIKMFNSIKNNVDEIIKLKREISLVIPAGIAIQNLRNTEVGDRLTKDGYHLSILGQYTTGLMWFKAITNENLKEINFTHDKLKQEELDLAVKAVELAYM